MDVDKILSYKKSDNEYVTRYNDLNRMKVSPLQLKIKNFFDEIEAFTNNDRVMYIENDNKELFKKCSEIWNKIIELVGINNAPDFVRTDSDDTEFIIADVHENTSFIESNYGNKLVIVLHSVFNNYPKTSLIEVKTNQKTIKK